MKQIGMMCLIALGLMGQTIVNPNGNGGGAPTTNPTGGANNYAAINGQTFTGAISAPGITDSTATAGQVWYGGTGGVRTGSNSIIADPTLKGTLNVLGVNGGGLKLGSYDATYGGFWSAAVTPSTTNYALIANSTQTAFNAPSGGNLVFSIGDTNSYGFLTASGSWGFGKGNSSLGANTTLSVLNRTALQGTAVYFCSDNNGDVPATTCRVNLSLGGSDSASTATLINAGTIKAGGYQSSDGTAGVTVTTCTGFKNGLCISGT